MVYNCWMTLQVYCQKNLLEIEHAHNIIQQYFNNLFSYKYTILALSWNCVYIVLTILLNIMTLSHA